MLQKVKRPDGKEASFEYDALGRRISKIGNKKITRYIWDGNVLLHEWSYDVEDEPKTFVDDEGNVIVEKEKNENVVTWIYDGNGFMPVAKLVNGKKYSVISDYLGTPIQSFDEKGNLVWERELDIYGDLRKGDSNFIPFLYQGQYFDADVELVYNRFRYYDIESGNYISKDPIGLAGGLKLYEYVQDSNTLLDIFGLSSHLGSNITFTDSRGLTLTVNGYTNISHLSDAQVKALYYANKGSGRGLSPKDAMGNVLVLHHYKQNPQGPIVAMPQQHHDKPHTNPAQHPKGKAKGAGLTAQERVDFNNWKKDYHAHIVENEMKSRGIKYN